MPAWDEWLRHLAETPRENGTAALHETAAWLADTLRSTGLEPELPGFAASPYALRLAGVAALVGGLAYARFVLRGRWAAALATALLVPALLLAELDFRVPVLSWLGAEQQFHVLARVGPEHPEQTLILAAHYDTKTDLLDHVERAPVDLLAAPLSLVLVLGALALALSERFPRRRRLLVGSARAAALAAVAYGLATFAALSAGAFLPQRSPGALDDGAACAVLLGLADALADAPPERIAVELLWLSAEEVGVEGSWRYAAQRFPDGPSEPTWVVNLEGLGASPRHRVLRRERFTLRAFDPDPRLFERLDRVHRRELGEPLGMTFYPGATDARSFLAHGVPALTLVTHEPGTLVTRGLHSADDDRSRLDTAALEASLRLLLAFVREVDAEPLR